MLNILKKNKFLKNAFYGIQPLHSFFRLRPLLFVKAFSRFFKEYQAYKKQTENPAFTLAHIYPCLHDNTKYTPVEPTYFFQDTWAAKKIFELKPQHHYDIGSAVTTIGILSQFVPTTMIDIRPLELSLDNLYFIEGSILKIPIEDHTLETISSLCVVEHIGLGRYGDAIDSFGSEKAIQELKRVVKKKGHILFSVPVDSKNKIYFNAHRAFTRSYILTLFHGFQLIEEKYHYGTKLYADYDSEKGFGTGFYMFQKI